jgi:hypothetical protein
VLENMDESLLATVKILEKSGIWYQIQLKYCRKECNKFAETRQGVQMMKGGRDKV